MPSKLLSVCAESQLDSLSLTTLRLGQNTQIKQFFNVITRFGDFWIEWKQKQKMVFIMAKKCGPPLPLWYAPSKLPLFDVAPKLVLWGQKGNSLK